MNVHGGRRPAMADIQNTGRGLPSRGFMHGTEGTGKTSFGCASPKPIALMTSGETGLATLLDAGRVPKTPHFPEIETFPALLDVVEVLRTEPHEFRTLVIDTVNGAERLCHEHVCRRDFGGRWGRDGFGAYGAGPEVAQAEWRELLTALDRLREVRHMGILALCHSKIAPFKNPEGPDYDRYTPDLHAKTWALTHRWADYVLFLNFDTHVDAGKAAKPKGKGGTRRVLHTERTAAFDAKNRHGLPARIDCGESAAEAWANLAAAMKAGRPATSAQDQPADVPKDLTTEENHLEEVRP
jgi:AAA domain